MYPTLEQVNNASHYEICEWVRFLPSPAMSYVGLPNFAEKLEEQATIMDRIVARLAELGGFTPEISKQLGW